MSTFIIFENVPIQKEKPAQVKLATFRATIKTKFVSVRNKVKGAWWVQKKVDGV